MIEEFQNKPENKEKENFLKRKELESLKLNLIKFEDLFETKPEEIFEEALAELKRATEEEEKTDDEDRKNLFTEYKKEIIGLIEKRLNSLPPEKQQAFKELYPESFKSLNK